MTGPYDFTWGLWGLVVGSVVVLCVVALLVKEFFERRHQRGVGAPSRGVAKAMTIELESIRRLDIKPGETLVATLPETATPKDMQQVKAGLEDCLPVGVKVLVVSSNIDLSVVSDAEASLPGLRHTH